MKKNDWILAISTLIYSYLFYKQGLGINFLLFTVCLIAMLIYRNDKVYKNKHWKLAAAGSFLSALCITIYGNGMSAFANILSLCILSALSFNPNTSLITSLAFSVYSIVASFVFMIIDGMARIRKSETGRSEGRSVINVMLYIVPFCIALLFFAMYRQSNALFNNFTNKINFNFSSAEYLLFTTFGFFLLYGFFYHKHINFIKTIDEQSSDTLTPENINTSMGLSVDKDRLSGMILFSMLNALLLMVNVLDVKFMWLGGNLPADLNYSELVHEGIQMLIVSIVFAILIIMYYFRGALNFYKENKSIKLLAYAWIIQNIFMVISTAYRNKLYIDEYSLTYLRIGVYVWLLLAAIGLITTFIKIFKIKSNWYLLRTNPWLFYWVLIISCFINWDVMLTEFNINQAMKNNKTLDMMNLLSLSDRNLPQLLSLKESNSACFYNNADYESILTNKKLRVFLNRMNVAEWQSWNYTDSRNYSKILKSYLKGDIKHLPLTNNVQYEINH